MAAYDLTVNRGTSFSLSLTLNDTNGLPIDLTNYFVSGFIKYRYSDSGILSDLNATKVPPYSGGNIALSIAPSGTALLPVGLSVYDVNIFHTGSGISSKVLYGDVEINPNVS